jgi:hypothetical protein
MEPRSGAGGSLFYFGYGGRPLGFRDNLGCGGLVDPANDFRRAAWPVGQPKAMDRHRCADGFPLGGLNVKNVSHKKEGRFA